MSRTRKRREAQQSNAPSSLKSKRLLISLGILLSVVLLVVFLMNSSRGSSEPADSEVPATNVATRALTASSDPLTALPLEEGSIEKRVIGRWLRTDGEYFIEITEVHDDGKLDAGYYNPYPINVAEAKVLPDADVFMKLQDENYPGSTYTLNYNPENDTLTGIYFHAGLQQEFEVVFNRLEVKE